MIKTFAKLEGFKVVGFFEADDEGPLDVDFAHQMVNEVVTSFPEAPTPSSELRVNTEGRLFWYETASIEDLKFRKNADINSARLKANRTLFTYQGKQIACDELSRSDIDAVNGIVAVTQALPPGWVGGWKAIDNTYIAITTVSQWIGFYGAMVSQGSSNFAHAQALKAQLSSATTVEEVEAIVWA